jgi:hypothetical protein
MFDIVSVSGKHNTLEPKNHISMSSALDLWPFNPNLLGNIFQWVAHECIWNFCSCSEYMFVTVSLVSERRERVRGSRTHTIKLGSVNQEQDGGCRKTESLTGYSFNFSSKM